MATVDNKAVSKLSRQDQILLVDDNPANLKILYETLDGRGYKLLVADSGEKALSIVRKSHPDLILLDVMMPGMDGFEVCRTLKQDPATASSSIIFLSALDDTDSKVMGFDAGGVDYISKPFQVKEVIARVETHLKIHRLEQQLEARNRELQIDKASILSAMSEGIYGLSRRGEIIFANSAAGRMNACDEGSLLGRSFVQLHFNQAENPEGENAFDLDRMTERLQRVLSKNEALRIGNALFTRPDGSVYPVTFTVTPTARDDHATHAVVVFHDTTEEIRQAEELEAARQSAEAQRSQLAHISRLSMMGEMAAGIAHEVNQPLTAIVNYIRVANRIAKAEQLDKALMDETLKKIESQCLRASQVIQHIRDFVKKPLQGKEILSANTLAKDILELAEIEAKEHGIELRANIEPLLPELYIEPVQVQQVALNLLRNGMEAMGHANMRGSVKFKVAQANGKGILFEVTDEGPGVAEEHQNNLFSPFFTTKKSGMGIGLTLCQSIIHSHGGEIGFRPGESGGSTFYFTLPVRNKPVGKRDQPAESAQ
ncbi:Signal transduction histidine kinase [Hahella chejuensis KCTC 2396]|uniref:histidine kinase n=1 Tax=Hahella chejuensis (strain KCTC 2396) TaxID=349521 RepID=Q2SBT0_HAHCH|nr:response regulator [Hahella chejuensis]ABC31894.1 Signal transduction histidine kinase [Hahella chejuensis KCTC 2396]